MRFTTAQENVAIVLGRQGENNVETVQFDVGNMIEEYGEGDFVLLHQRCQDVAPYPCEITVDNGVVNWLITSADVYYKGSGLAQLMFIVDDAVAKTVIYKTFTLPSIDGGEIPEPIPSWIEQVLKYGSEMEESQHLAEKWATGTVDGLPVPETDETYHNNAKYYAGVAEDNAISSAASATDAHASEVNAQASEDAAAQSATEAAAFVGAPHTALTAAGMTDTSKVYVYIGSESGYVSGNWYYYDGTAWVPGGVYNAVAVDVATVQEYLTALYS